MIIKYRRDLWQAVGVEGDSAEIGVAEGFFSADILSWPVEFPRHYMVDRWRHVPTTGDSGNPEAWHVSNYNAARERVAKFGFRPVFLRGDSADMAGHVPNRSLALLYIDGDHSYAGVMSDLVHWLPKVRKGGVVGFHDFENPVYGVKRAATEFCMARGFEIQLMPEDKIEDAGAYFIV